LLPVKLVFSQKYDDIKIARKIEIKIKRFKNRKIIEQIIKDGKIKMNP
jgi:predicted GIY-YIG superfamily endonuclease